MSGASWRIDDAETNPTPPGVHPASLVSLHYLRTALRRRWKVVAVSTLVGLILAGAVLALAPSKSTATATLLLAHDPSQDAGNAMATDVSLLSTRQVADRVISQLQLTGVSADQFQKSVTTSQLSTQLLKINLVAPTSRQAVERLSTLTEQFLTFRNAELGRQSDTEIFQNKTQIKTLRQQADGLDDSYRDAIAAQKADLAASILSQQTQITAQIGTLQQTIQQTALQTESLAQASTTVDPAAVVPVHQARRFALGLVSGLIGGAAVGIGLVVVTALISNRLRRREEVAMALGHPVTVSTGRVHGRAPWGRVRRQRNLDVLASGLAAALTAEGHRSLVLASAGADRAAATVVARTAQGLVDQGQQVVLVDLTPSGALSRGSLKGSSIPIHRPEGGRPELADGPLAVVTSAARLSERDPRREELAKADVVLVLSEVEVGVGTGHLATWADRSVLLVGAGEVTAEFLRTTGRMFQASGPELGFAMLVGTDSSDESFGFETEPVAEEKPARKAR